MKSESKILWIESKDLDIDRYDKLIEQSEEVNIYNFSWYLEAVADFWGALVLNNYEALMPIAYTVKKGQYIVYQPFFSRQIGVYGEYVNPVMINSFISAIPEKFKLIDFGFPYEIKVNYSVEHVVHQQLNLENSYDFLYSNYSTNTKRQLKKAVKNEVEIREYEAPEELINLFKNTKGEEIGLSEGNFSHLLALLKKGLVKKSGILLGAFYNEQLIASAYYFVQENRITYLKGAGSEKGREIGGMYLLMDFMISKYAGASIIFDFGGSKLDSIASFYKKFGAIDKTYYLYSKNKLPLVIKLAKNLRDKVIRKK